MKNEARALYDLPMSIKEINRKREAWKELFGELPVMEITGTFELHNSRELGFFHGDRVQTIGSVYLGVRCDEELCYFRPKPYDTSSATILFKEHRR